MIGTIVLSFCLLFVEAPRRYPDLWTVGICVYCCSHFIVFCLVFHIIQFTLNINDDDYDDNDIQTQTDSDNYNKKSQIEKDSKSVNNNFIFDFNCNLIYKKKFKSE
jgi:hypothetical protein